MNQFYEDASNAYISWLKQEGFDPHYVLSKVKEIQETNPRFHFSEGMDIRNLLRSFGFTDNIFGNLDDHYLEILKLCYEKIGLI